MEKNLIFLKTVFSCMVCDGDIAPEEVKLVKQLSHENGIALSDIDLLINQWITEINQQGQYFLYSYLRELASSELTKEDELRVVSLAFKTIEADFRIEYAEVKFFKKLRKMLRHISNDEILANHPGKDDFLLEDINDPEEFIWTGIQFQAINFTLNE